MGLRSTIGFIFATHKVVLKKEREREKEIRKEKKKKATRCSCQSFFKVDLGL